MVSREQILASLPKALKSVEVPGLGPKQSGKVRDAWVRGERRITVTTDRQSGFDRVLGMVPFKGSVLNELAAWWFEQTADIVPNHVIDVPDPNVLVSHQTEMIPVEMVVRGYMSGVTNTSVWGSYARGERVIYGLKFPDGLRKNERLPQAVITPTTHGGGASGHDERLTRTEIISREMVRPKLYEQMERAALELFAFGSRRAREQGLILVDTKYEFGLYKGKLMLIDEVHTPDSSRFWKAETYEARMAAGDEPENFDKEFIRLWYAKRGYTGDGEPPAMDEELVVAAAQHYMAAYEMLTGWEFAGYEYPIDERVMGAVRTVVR
jgi:phosphoribosylaminoimidazole-succinocarboxamide synthase